MPTRSEARVGLLEFEGVDSGWGVRSERLASVVSEGDWGGDPPVDAAQACGVRVAPDLLPRRVVLLRGPAREVPLLVRGKIAFLEVSTHEVLDLPDTIASHGIRELVVLRGRDPVWLLDASVLASLAPEPGARK